MHIDIYNIIFLIKYYFDLTFYIQKFYIKYLFTNLLLLLFIVLLSFSFLLFVFIQPFCLVLYKQIICVSVAPPGGEISPAHPERPEELHVHVSAECGE